MKWLKLLWSVVLLGFLALLISYVSSYPSAGKITPAFWFSIITWIAICIISPIILILRLLRILPSPTSFIYILTGTASLAIGLLGIYYVAPAGKAQNNIGTCVVLALNIFIGCFIYTDTFIKTIPGLRRDPKKTA